MSAVWAWLVSVLGKDPRNWALLALGLALAGSLFVHGMGPGEDEVTEADRLRTELLEARARADGWALAMAQAQEDLYGAWRDADLEADSLRQVTQSLVRELQAAEAQLISTSTLVTELRGELEARADPPTDSARNTPRDSATASIDDGLLSGRVTYRFPPEDRFLLSYQARVEAALVAAETPDRRLMVSVRTLDPRVSIDVEDLEYQAPEPIRQCTWTERGQAAGVGGVAGLVAGLIAGG